MVISRYLYIKKEFIIPNTSLTVMLMLLSANIIALCFPIKANAIDYSAQQKFVASDSMGCEDIINKAVEIYIKRAEDLIGGLKAGNITVVKLIKESFRTRRHYEFAGLDRKFDEFGCSIDELNRQLDTKYKKTMDGLRFNQSDLNNIRIK